MSIAERYLLHFQKMQEEEELKIHSLKLVLTERCEGTYDAGDRAEVLQRQNYAMQDIARHRSVIDLVAEVIDFLNAGWDGTCTTCRNVSALPRLAIGVPTTCCTACQCRKEMQIAQLHAVSRGGMLHMSIARGR